MFFGKRKSRVVTIISTQKEIESAIKSRRLAAVDQFGVQPFQLNDGGWPRNTISCLARCQTLEQYKLIAQRLVQMPVITDKNSKVPIKDRFALIRPRYAQTPTEMEALAQTLAEYDKNAIDTMVQKQMEKEALKDVKSDASVPAAPASE